MYTIAKFLFAFLILSPFVGAQTPPYAAIQNFCTTGGQTVKTSGMSSTNTVLATYPKCLVTVYLTGTLTPATIYKDSTGTPLGNPFIANADASWLFYVSNTGGQAYDITMTGGLPIAFPQPFTLIDVFPNNPGTGGGGGGNIQPTPQYRIFQQPTPGTQSVAGPTNITTDSTGNNVTIPGAATSAVDNNVTQSASHLTINAAMSSAGATGSVNVKASGGAIPPGPSQSSYTVATTGGSCGPGRYAYYIFDTTTGGGSWSRPLAGIVISSGTTNRINFQFAFATGHTYNVYGRVKGDIGFIKSFTIPTTQNFDDCTITPGASFAGPWSNPNQIAVNDYSRGILANGQHYLSLDQFGCVGDGVNEDGPCIRDALAVAKSMANGNTPITIQGDPSKRYMVNSIGGSIDLPYNIGDCPDASYNPTVNGVPCTPLGVESHSKQKFHLMLSNYITLRDMNLTDDYGPTTAPALSPDTPAMILCASSTTVTIVSGIPAWDGCGFTHLINVKINSYIDIFAPSVYGNNTVENSDLSGEMIAWIRSWDTSRWENVFATGEAGLVIGGATLTRLNGGSTWGAGTSQLESGGYADSLNLQNYRFQGGLDFLTYHARTDDYIWNYIYKGPNLTNGQIIDVYGTNSPSAPGNINAAYPYHGVFGSGITILSRYNRTSNTPYIVNYQVKNIARYLLYSTSTISGGNINILGFEQIGNCGSTYIGDPVDCPDPYGYGGKQPGYVVLSSGSSRLNMSNVLGTAVNYVDTITGLSTTSTIYAGVGQAGTGHQSTQFALQGTNGNGSVDQGSPGHLYYYSNVHNAINTSQSSVDLWDITPYINNDTRFGGYLDFSHDQGTPGTTGGYGIRSYYLGIRNSSSYSVPCDNGGTGYAATRGFMRFRYDLTNTAADAWEMCAKKADNTYAWQAVPLGNSFTSFSLGGSQSFTGVQGTTGTKIPAATGSFTNNRLIKTDANGNFIDSGVTGFTGTCAPTTTVTVSNGIITGCS